MSQRTLLGQALERRRTPLELSPDVFREVGHRLVDDVAELLGSLRDRPLTPGQSPHEVRDFLNAGASLPAEGTDPAELMAETTRLLLDHSLFNGHSRFFGYITAGPAPMGILADLLASAVNPNVAGWSLSPMASEIEDQAVRWIAELVEYPAGDGILVSGGNAANMLAFWAARAAKAGWDVRRTGMRGEDGRALRVYCAEGTHTWIQKSADLAGLGTESIRWVQTDSHGRMDVGALRGHIEADLAAGARPFMVVGTAGSVGIGSVDPLPALRVVCDEYDLWFHVDGAYGAFAVAAANAPADLRGLSVADSVALDPHKWLYTPLEAGCTLVRDPDALLAAFSYRPDYYAFEEHGKNFFEHGIQNSRGFRALKVWLVLKQAGRDAYARMIAEDIELARRFYRIADAHPELEALTQGLSITTYRYVPEALAGRTEEGSVARYLNELNEAIRDRMERSGDAFVSNAILRDTYALRMCVVNFRTGLEDVVALADLTAQIGRALDREMRPGVLPAGGSALGP
jgi:aromatic-L-amino-acid decarboxylase